MDDHNGQDRIQRDAADIAAAAADIQTQRSTELAAEGEEARIDAEMAKLARDRAAQDERKVKAHDAIVADEHRIADDDRDLRDAIGGGRGGGPAPGPTNPPVVPPRRVG